MNKKMLAILMVSVFILSTCGVLITSSSESDAVKRTLVVETSPDFAPYDYYYGSEFVGIDMDIIRAIGKDLDYNIQFKQNTFDYITLSVQNGKADVGASGFTITDERKKMVNFSDSYAEIKQVVVAKIGSSIQEEKDLKGKTVCVQMGTSGDYYVKDNLEIEPMRMNNYSEIVLALLNGKYDCEVVDEPVARAQVAAHPEDLKIFDVLNADIEHYGFIFEKSNTSLLSEFNNSLKRLKDDGTIDSILKYYADNGYRTDTPSYFDQEPTLFVINDVSGPYSYSNLGSYAGIDVDVMNSVAKDMGYRIRFIDVDSSEFLEKLSQSPNYIAIGGLGIKDLGEDYTFSKAVGEKKLVAVSSKDVPLTDPSGLAGKKIAVVAGTDAESYANSKGASSVTSYASVNYALDSVNRGETDYAIVDEKSAEFCMYGYKNALEIHEVLSDAPVATYGFLFSSSATELIEKVNESLTKQIENGTVEKINKFYEEHTYSPSTKSYYDDSNDSFWANLWDRIERCFMENDRYQLIITGLGNTVKITLVALVIGMMLGVVMAAVLSMNAQTGRLKIPAVICKAYVTVIRGTPVMIQLLIIYYVIFASVNLNPILVASVAFGLNSGAYVTEIVRSGINSVPKGQMEAARCLGLNTTSSMRLVIVPQAIRNILPALGNESISLLKETSIAGFIAIVDLTRAADIIRGQTYDALIPLLAVAAIYLVIVLFLQFLIKRLERRLNSAY